jgi:hypothetical protein
VMALYTAWGKTERVAEWKARLGEVASKSAVGPDLLPAKKI